MRKNNDARQADCRVFVLWYRFAAHKLVELRTKAIENADIHFSVDAPNVAVGAELPIHQAYVGLVFAVAGNPNVVLFFDVRSQRQVSVDKHLTDIQHRAGAYSSVNDA